MNDVTRILSAIEQGNPAAAEQLLPLVYEELRKLAAARLAQEQPGQTLQATALVHEAYLRLVEGQNDQRWDHRGHFFAAAAEAMRRILDTLPGSEATDVNDHGLVIGISNLGSFIDVPGVGLRFPAGQVIAVNNQGVVVGLTGDPSGPSGISGAVWFVDATGEISGPVRTTIGAGVAFIPQDINDEGIMAGDVLSVASDGSSSSFAAIAEFDHSGELHVTGLGVLHPGDTGSTAWSINSDGLVAGTSNGKTNSAFLFDPSQPNKLASLGSQFQYPGINDNAQIVFTSNNKANVLVGVIWQNGKTTDLNTVLTAPLNDTIVLAVGINNTGHIVGIMRSGNACILTPQ
jgi:hypothetical protein